MSGGQRRTRRLLAPEVIQASAMDCGPAALASLLRGFGIPADYARLRQSCQTDADGTSVDSIEEVARGLGLDVEQVMVPIDHVLRAEAALLPALAVVLLPGGVTHFVILWRAHGPAVQVMDPGSGREFTRSAQVLRRLFVHTHTVDAAEWRAWAGSDEFVRPLRGRLAALGSRSDAAEAAVREALEDDTWIGLAALDAAIRLTDVLVGRREVRRGGEAARVVHALAQGARARRDVVPERHWSVAPAGGGALSLRGAILVRVRGSAAAAAAPGQWPKTPEDGASAASSLRRRGWPLLGRLPRRTIALMGAALFLGLAATAAQVLLLNSMLHATLVRLGRHGQAAPVAAAVGAAVLVAGFDAMAAAHGLRLGRVLEATFRLELLRTLPHIADRHLSSWLRSDLAERAHAIVVLRELPGLALRGVRALGEIAVVTLALGLLFPGSATAALATGVVAMAIPLLAQPFLAERDVRLRSVEGALSRHYLDALIGSTAARAHGAEEVLCHEHGRQLEAWRAAWLRLLRALVATSAVQYAAALACAALVVVPRVMRHETSAGTLLLAFWALRLPSLGGALAGVIGRSVALRSTLLRLLEPLDAPREREAGGAPAPAWGEGCALSLRGVTVVAGGHTILDNIDLEVASGEHVALLGASGSGKSTLLGLLLGWQTAARGSVLVNGSPLDGEALAFVREHSAWLDPGARLWNMSLAANVAYGTVAAGCGEAATATSLDRILDTLPEGWETLLGEEGRLLSGGEGQRVRAARAFARPEARLAILDEPFRGLEHVERRQLLERARRRWRRATLICATHDIEDTTAFDHIVVLEGGRVVEQGRPAVLASAPSRYAAMLEEAAALADGAWSSASWRRVRLERGALKETP